MLSNSLADGKLRGALIGKMALDSYTPPLRAEALDLLSRPLSVMHQNGVDFVQDWGFPGGDR